jgi:hypothetical protein
MMDLKSDLIPTLLGQAQFPSFSPDLEALQSCTDDELLYELLLRAMEKEPFLLAKFVTRANSIAFGAPGEHFFTPRDCLSRVGLAEGLHTALDFYLEDALGPYIRENRHCVATWKEARIAAQMSKHLGSLCNDDFRTGAAFLATALSYVGELFALSVATTSSTIGINMGLYAQARPEQVDVFHISTVIIGKLQLPATVTRNFRQIREVFADDVEFPANAASILLARALAQSSQPSGVPVAQVSPECYAHVIKGFQLSEEKLIRLFDYALQTRQRVD